MRIFSTPFSAVYTHYVAKVEKKGRTAAEVDQVICWLTGFSAEELAAHLEQDTTFQDFFDAARVNPAADQITGSVCGVRVENVEDPLMRKIRYLDKLVDELAKGRPMEKVLRSPSSASGPSADRGPEFDGIRIGRPATGALIDAGYRTLADLPADLDDLLSLHGVGPSAVGKLAAAR